MNRWTIAIGGAAAAILGALAAQAQLAPTQPRELAQAKPAAEQQRDAVQDAQTPRQVPITRVEQRKTGHDQSDVFAASKAPPSSNAFEDQPDKGQALGIDFARDPLNAKRPMQTAEEIMNQDIADKPKVTSTQRRLLASRYDLTPKLDSSVTMSRGKPLAVGPTAHATDDRKVRHPSMGVACLDCHVNGHTTAQFHLNPDNRAQHRRFRLDTTSLRGLFNQQIHGSKRSLRSVEDFTEFEQRTAYFNGDPIRAMKKGINILDRIEVSHMAQMQNMFDFPPAPKLTTGKLDPSKATDRELSGERLFFGKAQCSTCHVPPTFLDHQMHDLKLERFLNEPPRGPIKTFSLRGIKDSPPYLHHGRLFTLEDTVEFFNLVLELKLTPSEKTDLVAYMRQL
jgi:hypothetical protein